MALIAGVDEVGRGCIAGAVFAAVVILKPDQPIVGLTDSKKLSAKQRLALATVIKQNALDWAIGRSDPSEIDQLNILQASLLAMRRAVVMLTIQPDQVLVDGNQKPSISYPCETIIKGDLLVPAISAASILAKVARDHEMTFLEKLYPSYGFPQHKGYPTTQHLQAIRELGLTPLHRRSFAPVRSYCL